MLRSSVLGLGLAAVVAGHGSRAVAQSFQLLDLPAGAEGSYATGVSYNGDVVSGRAVSSSNYIAGWSWSEIDGLRNVDGPGLPLDTSAYGISGDGRYLVGSMGLGGISSPVTAYRFDRHTGAVVALGALGGGLDQSRATGASHDGSVVVGFSISDFSSNFSRATRWTATGGLENLDVTRPDHHHSEALAVSADGNAVVGFSQGFGSQDAFLWTSTTGISALPVVSGAPVGTYRALGMNQDASFIVGHLTPNSGLIRGVMWHNGQAIDLGTNGLAATYARGVSDDGDVVVGQVRVGNVHVAGIWTPDRGFEPLSNYLSFIGVSVPAGVGLADATSISRDGRTITGYTTVSGNVQQPWVATIPAPGAGCILLGACLYTLRRRSRGVSPA